MTGPEKDKICVNDTDKILTSLSDEELQKITPISKEEIAHALQQGRKERDAVEQKRGPMNKTCKNCLHWERLVVGSYSKKYHHPKVPDKPQKIGECECEKFIYTSPDEGANQVSDALYYSDFEGYSAFIHTGENFGCIHFDKYEKDK